MTPTTPVDELDGLVGFAARAVDALGEWGVGLFTLVETVFPPIPSEVILPLAFRGAIAPLGSVLIALTKNTTVASIIGVPEASALMKTRINAKPTRLVSDVQGNQANAKPDSNTE